MADPWRWGVIQLLIQGKERVTEGEIQADDLSGPKPGFSELHRSGITVPTCRIGLFRNPRGELSVTVPGRVLVFGCLGLPVDLLRASLLA